MARRSLAAVLVPLWLLVMLAIGGAGLYLGYEKPYLALAIVLLSLVGLWLFWSSWYDTTARQ